MAERGFGITRKTGNFGVQPLGGGFQGGKVRGGVAIPEGVISDQIEAGFHSVMKSLVQGGVGFHGPIKTPPGWPSQDRKQETGGQLAPPIRFPPYP